jgi:hypothetical protein
MAQRCGDEKKAAQIRVTKKTGDQRVSTGNSTAAGRLPRKKRPSSTSGYAKTRPGAHLLVAGS